MWNVNGIRIYTEDEIKAHDGCRFEIIPIAGSETLYVYGSLTRRRVYDVIIPAGVSYDTAFPEPWADAEKARTGVYPDVIWMYDEKARIFGRPVSWEQIWIDFGNYVVNQINSGAATREALD